MLTRKPREIVTLDVPGGGSIRLEPAGAKVMQFSEAALAKGGCKVARPLEAADILTRKAQHLQKMERTAGSGITWETAIARAEKEMQFCEAPGTKGALYAYTVEKE